MLAAPPGSVDPAFNAGRGPMAVSPGRGDGLLIQPDGKIIVGATLNSWGLKQVGPIARLNPDGSLDPTFDSSHLAHGAVAPRALQSNGQIIVAPPYYNRSYGTRPVIRLNPNGSIDESFKPVFEGFDAEDVPEVRQVLILGSGKMLVSGAFSRINGTARPGLARLNTDGSLDQSFVPARTGLVGLQSSGKLIVTSGFRLNQDGSLDPSFTADWGADEQVGAASLRVQPDDKIVYSQGLGFDVYGVVRRWNADGSNDGSFKPFYGGQFVEIRLLQADGKIIAGERLNHDGTLDETFHPVVFGRSVAQQKDGKLVTAGGFADAPFAVQRLLLDGSLDDSFGHRPGLTIADQSSIERAAIMPDGRVAVAGQFNYFSDVARNTVAVLQHDGEVDAAFDPGGLITPEPYQDLFISSVAAQENGKLLLAVDNRLLRLNSDGSRDSTFHFSPVSEIYANVFGVVLQPDGRILLTDANGLVRLRRDGRRDTSFNSSVAGAVARFVEPDGRIMVTGGHNPATRLDADGSIDPAFPGVGGIPTFDYVHAIARQADGKYLVSRSDAATLPRLDVFFRLNSDGSPDPTFSADVASVQFIVVDASGITVAGNVATVAEGARGENRLGVIRLNSDGSRDATFQPVQFNPGAALNELLLDAQGDLIVAGRFSAVNGVARQGIARLHGGAPKQIANISTRTRVATGESVAIGGFIITGDEPKKVILRALGPSLRQSPNIVGDVLPDPKLALHDQSGAVIAENDNWRDTQQSQISATGIAPASSEEAAMVATLAPGSYTAVLQDAAGGQGIALVELYDLDPLGRSTVANISTRGAVGEGENVMIGGFILRGSEPSTIVVRALGPSLSAADIHTPLSDPSVTLHDESGAVVAANDNWADAQKAALTAASLDPSDAREAALITTLSAGGYTAVVRGTR